MKWIQIWYSWGEQETAVEVPEGTDSWEYMKTLAINEAATSFRGHEEAGEIGLKLYKEQKKICLHYPHDDEYCYYLATDTKDYDPDKESAVLSGAEISMDPNTRLKAVNIEWDVDDPEDLDQLPREVDIPAGMTDNEEISNYLTDITGFCHRGFTITK